jgi:hypothetical protein
VILVQQDFISQISAEKKAHMTNQNLMTHPEIIIGVVKIIVMTVMVDAPKVRTTDLTETREIINIPETDTDHTHHIIEDHKTSQETTGKVALAGDQTRMTDLQAEERVPQGMTDAHTVQIVSLQVTTINDMIADHLARQEAETVIDQITSPIQKTCKLRHGENNTCHAYRNIHNPRFQ